MDLIRWRLRPPVAAPLPASLAPEQEGTGRQGLSRELGEEVAGFLSGAGGSALVSLICLGASPALAGGCDCWEGHELAPGAGLGGRQLGGGEE